MSSLRDTLLQRIIDAIKKPNEKTTQIVAHAISGGDKTFDAVSYLTKDKLSIAIEYTGIDTNDVTVIVKQKIGNVFDDIAGASFALDKTKSSHTFNFIGLNTDFVQVSVTQGTATTGTIDTIFYLAN